MPGLTLTLATGTGVTVAADVPTTPSTVAEMVAMPVVTAVTSPEAETVATGGFAEAHRNVAEMTLPFWSRATAVSCCVDPSRTENGAGVTVTVVMTGVCATVIVAAEVPETPSDVAVIVADPAATPVTSPLLETVATLGALLCQVTTRPVRTELPTSRTVAVNCCVASAAIVKDDGATVTVATAGGVTVPVA